MRILGFLACVFLLDACSTPTSNDVLDGVLEVPENRGKTDSRTLRLVYKVLKSKDSSSKKAPIVFLQGGPGGASLTMEGFWSDNPLRNERDIVLMDQRGTGISEANCIELGHSLFSIIREDLDEEGDYLATRKLLNECKETLHLKGVDLAGYNSREIAADFEDLRKTLGYGQWNLFGASYGSRLGMTIMRDFPNSVRSAILVSVLAPQTNHFNNVLQNFENSLFQVLQQCMANPECNARFPKIKERLLKALKRLDERPLRIDYKGSSFMLNVQDAIAILHLSLYDRHFIKDIPLMVEALEGGKTDALIEALHRFEGLLGSLNVPMSYSVMAYEELPFYDGAKLHHDFSRSEVGSLLESLEWSLKLLEDWHPYRASQTENEPVISEIPALMVGGGLDPITPIQNLKAAMEHLKNGQELFFSHASHHPFNDCFFQISENFLNDPWQQLDAPCADKANPIEWNLVRPAP